MEIRNMFYVFLVISLFAASVGTLLSDMNTQYGMGFPVQNISAFNKATETGEKVGDLRSGLEDSGLSSVPVIGELGVVLTGIANMIKGMFSLADIFDSMINTAITTFPALEYVFTSIMLAFSVWIGWEIVAWIRGFKS